MLVVAELAGFVAIIAGIVLLFGLPVALIVGGVLTIGVCVILELAPMWLKGRKR